MNVGAQGTLRADSEELQTGSAKGWRLEMLSRVVVFASLAALGCAADLWTKHLFFDLRYPSQHGPTEADWLWQGVLGVQPSLNQGALFGLGQGSSSVLAAISIFAAVGIVIWLFGFGAGRDWSLTIPLGAICGGILGNLYDRLGMWHGSEATAGEQQAVRDWIHFRWEGMPLMDPWPNFNVADALLVCGAIALFIHMFWLAPQPENSAATSQATPADAS